MRFQLPTEGACRELADRELDAVGGGFWKEMQQMRDAALLGVYLNQHASQINDTTGKGIKF
jgi:hypothetical protein